MQPFKVQHRASDPEDGPEGVTKRDIIRVLGEGRCSIAAVPVLNPVNMCGVNTQQSTEKQTGTHTHFACSQVPGIILIELRATEPAEDALHPEKIHTAVLLYGEDFLLCYTFTTELQPILRHCTTAVLTTVLHCSPPLCPPPWPC